MGAANTPKGDTRGVCEGGWLPIFAGDGVLNKKLHFDLRKKMLIVQQIFIDEQILRTSIDDCDIIYITCKVKIGNSEEELKTKVSHKIQ